ncbi:MULTISPECIES: glucose-6-phosphate isomerase [unclassified Colwellia]|uniref:glucose-6-phosphate isomerase n=1 Tax=unclassified Colwellia TaxID=196834 RepID=UPI0015F53065|nr:MULTISPECIES: glucose-6-phosphate isomerase [unclassified Colwellia]MBA6230599.1 glucose-6-phosphate isomerase [Colwellia sp. MB02u-7]MBA6234530.1 glucose-6-phosphate isomerase [Colwellia sp. MB02u-11]MBA6255394.1 glucose-6-phosphate isomerase [Colwellia sp. MB3u-28]MBA6261534.1 glucose-6-phosphate isomerase [Colwellia sp. MB3u-41]MBA6301084.1 glucose-6-phosphate isomerase [Colwellia sp. MB3u-22]
MSSRQTLNSWKKLTQLAQEKKSQHMNDLFAQDSERFDKFSIELPKLLLDYSKNLIDSETMKTLFELATECKVLEWREKMFIGAKINKTEDRAVLHTALRRKSKEPLIVDGENVTTSVQVQLEKMEGFVNHVREGKWLGYSGKRITDVVNIGVGGSNLGPQMVTEALKHYSDNSINVHYVSNVDGAQIVQILRPLDPERVLFIVSSKTFTTTETMTNAKTAIRWLTASSFDDNAVGKHFVAVTANKENAMGFGIKEENIFGMWDWVGGRFSLWSAIGLAIALDLGFDKFMELLDGANEMDEHFQNAPIEQNMPAIMALLSVWNTTFLGARSQAILPYDQTLHMLSAYLQQAEMESNGKSVSWNGDEVDYATVPSIWGELGINGQHAFYQYLHQSNNVVPADFIGSVASVTPVSGHHETLMSNFFAQTQALMTGVNEKQVRADLKAKGRIPDYIDKVAPHKVHKGNRPTNTILLKRIDPKTLGNLIALYEHKIFVQGIVLQICSFDQWGVELGKGLAESIHKELESGIVSQNHDCSTLNLMNYYNKAK